MLLLSSFAVPQLRTIWTGTFTVDRAGTSTVICVVATAKMGALTPPKVTHTPANAVESEPAETALIWGALPAAMKFEP